MRESVTQHTFHISYTRNTTTGNLLPSCYGLDFQRIAEWLSTGGCPRESVTDISYEQKSADSKKRVAKGRTTVRRKESGAGPSAGGNGRPVKRARLEGENNVSAVADSDMEGSTIPIMRCTFDLVFANDTTDKDKEEIQEEVAEERDFLRAVQKKIEEDCGTEDGCTVIDVGTVYPSLYSNIVCASFEDHSIFKKQYYASNYGVVQLPSIVDEDVVDAHHDFNIERFRNVLAAAYHMQSLKRAKFSGSLQLVIPSRILVDPNTQKLSLSLRVTFTVSLRIPKVFELYTPGRRFHEEEEAQRRVLTYAFGIQYAQASNYRGSTDIPFFLSCLHPAPSFPQKEKDLCMQPKDLLPTLLPFQRRSVGWMLSREAKELDASGEIIDAPSDTSELPLFWEKIQIMDGQDLYFNRLTGQLSVEQPPEDDFRGGILAEEPGLGKTLESIALVMLNPGIGRSPSVSRYDPVGVIEVKEIKVIIIIPTPSYTFSLKKFIL